MSFERKSRDRKVSGPIQLDHDADMLTDTNQCALLYYLSPSNSARNQATGASSSSTKISLYRSRIVSTACLCKRYEVLFRDRPGANHCTDLALERHVFQIHAAHAGRSAEKCWPEDDTQIRYRHLVDGFFSSNSARG